ncbi:MAG: polysaccharide biosynthesis protein [Dehalococcoidia bacterium]|nr:polysaccharide biosynthesis protein [Dehalococcoidia bacterium]|tara:strand:+ start:1967 stop:3154 length:1188 start_codon:yes stop_codon:yes gene_type:complete
MSTNRQIPMASPDISAEEISAVKNVLQTSRLSQGPQVESFELLVADYVGAKHAVAVSSGTAALHLSVIAAGVEDGDLVITTPFSFVASSNVLLYERAVPVFVDVDPFTFNIDPKQVLEAIKDLSSSSNMRNKWLPPKLRNQKLGKAKSILAVDVFGQPAEMDQLKTIARDYDLSLIEDSAEAIGSRYEGRPAGNLGDVGIFAFYPNKQITTGEGGVAVTDNDEWASLFRSLRNQGRDVFDGWLGHSRLGYNYRLNELSAAIGVSQMNRIEKILSKRNQVANLYSHYLAEINGVNPPQISKKTTKMSWFVYVVRLNSGIDRDGVVSKLLERGIPSRPYFPSIHLLPFYREKFGFESGDFPISEEISSQTIALPFYTSMNEQEIATVCEALDQILNY